MLAIVGAVGRAPTGLRNQALIVLLAAGALRLEEALRVRRRDVDLDGGTVAVCDRQGRERHVVSLDPLAFAVLKLWDAERASLGISDEHPFVCTLAGGPVHDAYVRRLLMTLAERAGVPRVTTRGLRGALRD